MSRADARTPHRSTHAWQDIMPDMMESSDSLPMDWFTIVNEGSGMVLDVPYAKKDPRCRVWVYSPNGSDGDLAPRVSVSLSHLKCVPHPSMR